MTRNNNTYTYNPRTNEIVLGEGKDEQYRYSFLPYCRFSSMPNLDMFIIGITEQCNLRCSYCCYSGLYKNNRTHSTQCMKETDIASLIAFIEQYAAKRPIHISFYGGEPLTHYSFLQSAVTQMKARWKNEVSFYVATNAVLLSEEKMDWFVEHNVEIGISIDGTKTFHDKNRVDANGIGSFSKVYSAISYLHKNHPRFFQQKVFLLMTLPKFEDLLPLAESWHNDTILKSVAPTAITTIAPNFDVGVERRTWQDIFKNYSHLLDIYEQHSDWIILKTYLNQCIKYWENRPVMDYGTSVPLSTCMPNNRKVYIDANGGISVCEKISDQYRIGNIGEGVDWQYANTLSLDYYDKRKTRCANCSAIRMCQLCLTSLQFTEEQIDVLCHNERLYNKLFFWLFCEMAERGMLEPPTVPSMNTERCLLDVVTEKDTPSLRTIFSDEITQRFLPELCEFAKTDDGIRHILDSFNSCLEKQQGILWAIRQDEKLIGIIATMDIPDHPSIFYAMHPKYRGKGIMTECLAEVVDWFSLFHPTSDLYTEVFEDNIISIAVLNRCGFRVYKEFDGKIFMKADILNKKKALSIDELNKIMS